MMVMIKWKARRADKTTGRGGAKRNPCTEFANPAAKGWQR